MVAKKDALLGIVVANCKKCGVTNIANVLSIIVTTNKSTVTFELLTYLVFIFLF